jgi:LacI family transcriptional regulator
MTGQLWVKLYVMLPLEHAYARNISRGVRAYQPTRIRWHIDLGDTSGLEYRLSEPGVVAIALVHENEVAIPTTGACWVNVSDASPWTGVPRVTSDNYEVGRMAARHFLDLEIHHHAYVGGQFHFDDERRRGFEAVLVEAGARPAIPITREEAADPMTLKNLPTPIGIFSSSDKWARGIVDACREAGLAVPDQVSVMGTDNDDLYCEAAHPHLTSADLGAAQIGFRAAALLEQLLLGAAPPVAPILIPPVGIVHRESTGKRFTDDPILIRALDYIRKHAADGLSIGGVAKAISVNRRVLQSRYRATFGVSLRNEILRAQIARARQILAETNIKIIDVAAAAGFTHSGRFAATFRRIVGETPATFRQRRRLR